MKLPCILLAVMVTPLYAFQVDAFRSGMTVEELKGYATRNGLDFKTQPNGIQHAIGNFAKYEILGSFTTCNNKLVSYHRTIDPDTAYVNILNEMLAANGQPKVGTDRLQVYGRPGVYSSRVEMKWYVAGDRINLSMSPELRDGKGELIFQRGASLEYSVRSHCFKDF